MITTNIIKNIFGLHAHLLAYFSTTLNNKKTALSLAHKLRVPLS